MTKLEQQKVYKEVVPLVYLDKKTGKEEFDGTGFLTVMDMEQMPVLITCSHNLCFTLERDYSFIYNEKRYLITPKPETFFSGDNKEIRRPNDPDTNEKIFFTDDYAFYLMPGFSIVNPITLGSTKNVLEGENLLLITHDPDTGVQTRIPCERSFYREKVSKEGQNGIRGDFKNLIHLTCDEAKPGHSGGVIFRPGENECIGILHARSIKKEDKEISILKGQSIRERYKEFHST